MSIDDEQSSLPDDTSENSVELNQPFSGDYWEEPLTPKQAGKFLKRSTNALAVMRCRENGPAYSKCGGSIRYTRRRLKAWDDKNLRTPLNS